MRAFSGARPARWKHVRGFSLVSAIFLIVILASLSAYLVGLRAAQEAGSTLDILGTRAYAAARAGIEWGVFNSVRNGACAAPTAIALAGTLSDFSVTVTCNAAGPYNEAGANVFIDSITVTACNNAVCPQATPGPNYVERQITAVVRR